jgi:hypothetical protein
MNGEDPNPKDSSSGNSADKNVYLYDYEEASDYDYVLESGVDTAEAGSGVYLQTEVASNHGRKCVLPFPDCGKNSHCMPRTGGRHAICIENNKCYPEGVKTLLARNGASMCCNGYRKRDLTSHGIWKITCK